MTDRYARYTGMKTELRDHGVLLITLSRPDVLNATDAALHKGLSIIWRDIADDDDVRVVVLTGEGRAFSAGGDLDWITSQVGDYAQTMKVMQEAGDLVRTMVECDKPIISAINGVAVGAGLAAALMADISIIAENAKLTDGHMRLGVAAGDHATIIWPLLCGLARAKYYLLTCDFLDGREAERIGLVSKALPADEVLPEALRVAEKLALSPQHALRFTKRSLNHWVRQALPTFEHSLALEMLGFLSPDAAEGVAALKEKRAPQFPSAQ